jgi:hypothetical protein
MLTKRYESIDESKDKCSIYMYIVPHKQCVYARNHSACFCLTHSNGAVDRDYMYIVGKDAETLHMDGIDFSLGLVSYTCGYKLGP